MCIHGLFPATQQMEIVKYCMNSNAYCFIRKDFVDFNIDEVFCMSEI